LCGGGLVWPPPPPPPVGGGGGGGSAGRYKSYDNKSPEVESKEKHGVWASMPELTITSPYVDSRVDLLQHLYYG
jgi:hypothetical protein